jgi:adenylate cyclase
MDRIWQWAWDRYGARYSWATSAVAFIVSLPIYFVFLSLPIVAFEGSGRYVEAAVITVAAVLVLVWILVVPGLGMFFRPVEQWAAGHAVDRATALEATYSYVRRATTRAIWGTGAWAAALSIVIGAAETIGAGGKLEFTLIGDTVNVAPRVEQLTKTTGDAILLTQQTVDALSGRPLALLDRGSHAVKGKSASVQVFAVDV